MVKGFLKFIASMAIKVVDAFFIKIQRRRLQNNPLSKYDLSRAMQEADSYVQEWLENY